MLSAGGLNLQLDGLFRSDGVQSLPLSLLGLARDAYVNALHSLLVRAAGAPARLVFGHGQDRHGYQICLLPSRGLDPLALTRAGVLLDDPIRIVRQSQEELWMVARTMGVSREMFDADYQRAQQAFADTPVTGWDVVRYLSLGGGMRNVTSTEGQLAVEVSQYGLSCSATPLFQNDDAADGDDGNQVHDSPQFH